jgi:AraC-like DNA-binding protein
LQAVVPDAPIDQRILQVVMREDGPRSFEEVADSLGTSTRTLKRRLTEAGVTFTEIVNKARCEHALLLLRSASLSLDEVADRLGDSTPSNLVRAFRRWTGMTPAAYRRSTRIGTGPFGPSVPLGASGLGRPSSA